MSLDPEWFSTLFGLYFLTGCGYAAVAAIFITTVIVNRKSSAFVGPEHYHDLGKTLLGFTLVTGDFFFSQVLLIWYGALPEETAFLILRSRFYPWWPFLLAVLLLIFIFPLIVLLNRKIKMKPVPMVVLNIGILVGMWLERFLLIVPSLWKGEGFPLGFREVAISAGFLGSVAACAMLFLARSPRLPLSDPLFLESMDSEKIEKIRKEYEFGSI